MLDVLGQHPCESCWVCLQPCCDLDLGRHEDSGLEDEGVDPGLQVAAGQQFLLQLRFGSFNLHLCFLLQQLLLRISHIESECLDFVCLLVLSRVAVVGCRPIRMLSSFPAPVSDLLLLLLLQLLDVLSLAEPRHHAVALIHVERAAAVLLTSILLS